MQTVITIDFVNRNVEVLPEWELEGGSTVSWSFSDIELLQCTSIKDRKGGIVYEGDIVKFHYFYETLGEGLGVMEAERELIGVIKMDEFGWVLSRIEGKHWSEYTGYDDSEGSANFIQLYSMNEGSIHEESFEIIGNIYENPELLNR